MQPFAVAASMTCNEVCRAYEDVVVSLLYVMENGDSAEIAVVGNEGTSDGGT